MVRLNATAVVPHPTGSVPDGADDTIYPRRHLTTTILSFAVLGFVAIAVTQSVITNERFSWDVVGEYIFSPEILSGLWATLALSVVCMILATILGTVIAVMRLSNNRALQSVAWGYVWIFRAVPVLVQLIFWYNLAALYPEIGLSIPFGPSIWSSDTNSVMTALSASILGLALHEAANMAEIVRSGIMSVDKGQVEAAEALGLKPRQRFRRVVFPQAMRIIIPPTGSQVLGMVKMTTLVSVLAMGDLLFSAQMIYTKNFQPIPLLIVASIWYLIVTSILMVAQSALERRLGGSVARP